MKDILRLRSGQASVHEGIRFFSVSFWDSVSFVFAIGSRVLNRFGEPDLGIRGWVDRVFFRHVRDLCADSKQA